MLLVKKILVFLRMSYSINNPQAGEYLLTFTFERQSCDVHVSVKSVGLLHIESLTDGYHWLQYFLSQDPEGLSLSERTFSEEIEAVTELFKTIGIKYEQEDKETAFLHLTKAFNLSQLDQIAKLMEPRFALRERFYD